jgi:hypothetical protein
MPATLYPVLTRNKAIVSYYATPADFGRGAPEQVPARRVLDEPGWAPYCLDDERREIVFVRIAPEIDLSAVPFFLVTQYEQADQIITVPFEEAHALAEALPDPNLVFIFNIGRCGTTLVSHALNGPANVVSVSEPGAFEHRQLRTLAAREDVSPIMRDLTRLTFAARSRRNADTLVVKLRSQVLFVAEPFWNTFPDAKYVFMYRDAVGWGNSFLQFLSSMGIPMPFDTQNRDFHWMMVSADTPLSELARFIPIDQPPENMGAILAPGWTIQLEQYERLLAAGLRFYPLRYNELMRDREGELQRLFDHCGLPHDGIAAALLAFDRDSQEGTQIARRDNPRRMDAAELATYRATLARVPRFADPDVIVPDTARG